MSLKNPIVEKHGELPAIVISNTHDFELSIIKYFEKIIQFNLRKMIKEDYLECSSEEEKIQYFKKQLPFISWDISDKAPFTLTIRSMYDYRIYSSKFIYDIISRWLIPGKRLNIISQFGSDFAFKEKKQNRFIMVELHMSIETREDYNTVNKTLPLIASEIRIGVESISKGRRILEIKGLNVDDKINLIQEAILGLINQKPVHFDQGLFSEMQRFFIFSEQDFKQKREYRHLVRIICWQYLFRKSMQNQDGADPQRQLRIKLMKTRIHYPYGAKTVLGVLIGLNKVHENERFGESQITRSIQNSIPNVRLVTKSFLSNKRSEDEGILIYAEFEKSDHTRFTFQELSKLRNELPEDLKGRIEQFMHPIFMPRNEEEIMRNILNLSKQLRSHNDIPQIIITFDSQSEQHITYSIILLRVVKNDEHSIQDICSTLDFKYEFIPDRIKIVGHVKRNYVKEANVFYVRLEKQTFLRKDHSLDLYKARQAVLEELYRIFKDVRDYNGGMIAKENELFNELKKSLKVENNNYSELVLENFFYNITPVIMRSMFDIKPLETSFLILNELLNLAIPKDNCYMLKFLYQSKYIFAYVVARNPSFQKSIDVAVTGLKLSRFQFIKSFIKVEGSFYLGLIFHSERIEERKRFCEVIQKSLDIWSEKELN